MKTEGASQRRAVPRSASKRRNQESGHLERSQIGAFLQEGRQPLVLFPTAFLSAPEGKVSSGTRLSARWNGAFCGPPGSGDGGGQRYRMEPRAVGLRPWMSLLDDTSFLSPLQGSAELWQ